MSKWVVDTCVLIDIISNDGEFAVMSADALDAKRKDGLTIAPVTYIELSPSFRGNEERQNQILAGLGIEVDFGDIIEAVRMAHKSWNEYVIRKRAGVEKKRPVADVLIVAYALSKGGLITRNETDFRSLFPGLRIFNPSQTGG